jgi:hypothetical protein
MTRRAQACGEAIRQGDDGVHQVELLTFVTSEGSTRVSTDQQQVGRSKAEPGRRPHFHDRRHTTYPMETADAHEQQQVTAGVVRTKLSQQGACSSSSGGVAGW